MEDEQYIKGYTIGYLEGKKEANRASIIGMIIGAIVGIFLYQLLTGELHDIEYDWEGVNIQSNMHVLS